MDTPRLFTGFQRHGAMHFAVTTCVIVALSACQPSVQPDSDTSPAASQPSNNNASILILNPDGSVNESENLTIPQALTFGTPPEQLDEPVETIASDGTVTIMLGNRYVRPLTAQLGCDDQLILSHRAEHAKAPPAPDCSIADTKDK